MHEAIVTKIKVQPHPNPEVHSLAVGYLFGETIIVSKDTKDGDLGIYFPCELQLGEEFAEKNDLIRRKNEDGTSAGGMFDPNRRVRVQKFKGVKSNGFWCPLSYLTKLGDISSLKEGDKLTTFNGYEICRKYVTPETFSRNKNKIIARKDSIWFPKHKDTEQFKYNLRDFRAGDVCVVTLKMHGCVHESTIIETLEHGPKTIGEIVNNKVDCHIKARDIISNEDVFVPIDQHYRVDNDGDWYELEMDNGTRLIITGNNPVWLPEQECYRRVDELIEGDVCLVE